MRGPTTDVESCLRTVGREEWIQTAWIDYGKAFDSVLHGWVGN
jgi:hypothetical protein